MKILLFEWLLGGGGLLDRQVPDLSDSIWRQGLAMAAAVAADFHAAGCEVIVPVDARLPRISLPGRQVPIEQGHHLPNRLRELAVEADRLFLIAPESAGRLTQLLDWLEDFAAKLLSPSRTWVELCSDKHRCLEALERAGIDVPRGVLWQADLDVWPPNSSLPAILKPNDGCGGENLRQLNAEWGVQPTSGAWRLEPLIPGDPLSILALAGPRGSLLLHPTVQHFAPGRLGEYIGGELVTDPLLGAIASEAGARILAALPGMVGMFGFDLIVDRTSRKATLIEINPRLTSSYLGLREAYQENLAGVLLSLFRKNGELAPLRKSPEFDGSWSLLDAGELSRPGTRSDAQIQKI